MNGHTRGVFGGGVDCRRDRLGGGGYEKEDEYQSMGVGGPSSSLAWMLLQLWVKMMMMTMMMWMMFVGG